MGEIMSYRTNQFFTLLAYILLLSLGSILTMFSITGSAYFITVTIAALIVTGLMIYLVKQSGPLEFEKKSDLNHDLQWIILGTVGALVVQFGIGFLDQLVFHASTNSQNTIGLLLMVKEYPYYFLRSEEHTSELQSRFDIVCRLL